MELEGVRRLASRLTENVEKVYVGKSELVELLIAAILVEGHVLLEDVPGVGKTILARSLAISLGGDFKRLQCTPDLLPNDVTGVSVFNQQTGQFDFQAGPVFVNILLADEINRATPRTQSALLEAMQERQVTVDGTTHPLPRPFLVLATQNPIEYEGTFPLPEAQLDRFLLRMSLGYPDTLQEKSLFRKLRRQHPIDSLEPIAGGESLSPMQELVWDVHIDETLEDYILALTKATRDHSQLVLGVSPRGGLALYKASQALAAIRGRDHVLPDDVKFLVPFVFAHRLLLKPEAELRGLTADGILKSILESTPLEIGNR